MTYDRERYGLGPGSVEKFFTLRGTVEGRFVGEIWSVAAGGPVEVEALPPRGLPLDEAVELGRAGRLMFRFGHDELTVDRWAGR